MNKIFACLMTCIFIAFSGFSQTGKLLTGSGMGKLRIFLGTWKSHNLDSADRSYAIYTCSFSANGNYLIADQLVTDADNKTSNNLGIYSYDSSKDDYTLSVVGIPNMDPFTLPVTYKGDDLTYSSSYMDNGTKVYVRTLNTFISSALYEYQTQVSRDSVSWKTTSRGKAVKIRQ